MLKRLAILGLLIPLATIGILASQDVAENAPKQGVAKPESSQSSPQKPDSQNAKASSENQLLSSSQIPPKGCDENCQNERQNLNIQRKIEWFTGVLAGVGILQGVVLFLTWKAISRQADLQRFLTRQWVDVGDWHVIGDDPRQVPAWDIPDAEEPGKHEPLRDSMKVHLTFTVFNNTPLPLTLHRITTSIKIGSRRESHEIKAYIVLPPTTADKDNSFECMVPVGLTEDEVMLYARTCLGFLIKVRVYFGDAEGVVTKQIFIRTVAGGVRTFVFGKDLEGKTSQADQRPNPN